LNGGARQHLRDGRVLEVQMDLLLDESAGRYWPVRLGIKMFKSPDADLALDPGVLRQVRWAEVTRCLVELAPERSVHVLGRDGTPITDPLAFTEVQRIGGLWARSRLCGANPNQYIAEQLGITSRQAAHLVAKARAANPPSIPLAATQGER
jgi:hypothetical protein